MSYQERDREVIDYLICKLEGTDLEIRGPNPRNLEMKEYFVCIGAAQTFGCFCKEPYPTILAGKLGMPALNLGFGGAGPTFFLMHRPLLEYINRAKFAVVQIMSGRSVENSLFKNCTGVVTRKTDGKILTADEAYDELLKEGVGWWPLLFGRRYAQKLTSWFGQHRARRIVSETRQNWVRDYLWLLRDIKVPKILFWFSVRKPEYREMYMESARLFGAFPQLVNKKMVELLKPHCEEYVECVTRRGLPQKLISRFTGKPVTIDPWGNSSVSSGKRWTHNPYYPSPQMHIDAAQALLPVCGSIMRSTPRYLI